MITTTKDRLTIHEPHARLMAVAMAEEQVLIRVTGNAAILDRDEVAALVRWLTAVTK